MRNLKTILGSLVIAFLVTSCSNNDTTIEKPLVKPSETKTIENFHAPAGGGGGNYTGDFAKFSFKEGKKVDGDNWDIAFRATEIIVNGGVNVENINEEPNRTGKAAVALVKNTLKDLKEAPADSEFKQDAKENLAITKGSNNGWYLYNFKDHVIEPKAGIILVVKTIEGSYAKVEIESYYKDKKINQANGRYFTFKYVYNPNPGDKNLQ
ncbi:HmuY protein [Tenacibaculum sp. 190524A02b]|uniref:HmuY family protein n=1 Tax=Tenacibaculum vairaonense TaxID=3137860 RepID=UPI0032B1A279